jgi:hypothetical protein
MVYFLRFSEPLGNPHSKQGLARYYVGWAQDTVTLERRLEYHRSGRGAHITRAAALQGISMELVLAIPGDNALERKIKNEHNNKRVLNRYLNKLGRPLEP